MARLPRKVLPVMVVTDGRIQIPPPVGSAVGRVIATLGHVVTDGAAGEARTCRGVNAPAPGEPVAAAGACLGQVGADRTVADRDMAGGGIDAAPSASPNADVPPRQRLVAGDRARADGQGAGQAVEGPAVCEVGGALDGHVPGEVVPGKGQVGPIVQDAAPLIEGVPVRDRQAADGHVLAGRDLEHPASVVAAEDQPVRPRALDGHTAVDEQLAARQRDRVTLELGGEGDGLTAGGNGDRGPE